MASKQVGGGGGGGCLTRWWSREGGRVVVRVERKSCALLGFWPWLRSRWGGIVTREDEEGESVCAKRRGVVSFVWSWDADECRRWRIKNKGACLKVLGTEVGNAKS